MCINGVSLDHRSLRFSVAQWLLSLRFFWFNDKVYAFSIWSSWFAGKEHLANMLYHPVLLIVQFHCS